MGRLKEQLLQLEEQLQDVADTMADNYWTEVQDFADEKLQELTDEFHCDYVTILEEAGVGDEDFEEFSNEDWSSMIDDAIHSYWEYIP